MNCVDSHAHVIPIEFLSRVRKGVYSGITIERLESGQERILFGGRPHPCHELFWDMQAQLAFMQKHQIDRQAVCISPRLFFYDWKNPDATALCRICNNALLKLERESNAKLMAVGGLPLQSIADSLTELDYLHENGVKMVQIGTSVNEHRLGEQIFEQVWQRAANYRMVVMLHPLIENSDPRIKEYHLSNVVGNPSQTTAAAGNLIFSGMLDRVPELKILLVHGSGFLPYQLGRMNHAYRVRPEDEHPCRELPSGYFRRNFWSDGLTHDAEALRFLISKMGEDRVLYGSDYPYDMAEYDEIELMRTLGYGEETIEKVAGKNFYAMLSR